MNYPLTLILRLLTPLILSYSLIEKFLYPLTLNTSYFLLKFLNYKIFLFTPYLITLNNYIRFSPACAAISAYFLLLLLIIFTKDIKLLIRIKIFFLGSLIIFLVNLIRILTLVFILEKFGFNTFQQVHDIFWILFGSILVAFTWIYLTKHYKITSIPLYSDLKYLLKQINVFKQ